MKRLCCPWRIKYITSPKTNKCVFCENIKENTDEKNLILLRGKYCFIMLNLYPYNNGHLMIIPYAHKANLTQLSQEEYDEMMFLAQVSIEALQRVMNPHGFNLGMNIGNSAGAGIADHVHLHVVPRWEGDSNFMLVIGDTKVIPEDLPSTYKKLYPVVREIYEEKKKS
ncbi:MAG: HIT domain-containing protein [Dictyoglomus sp.]|nr:HIT domain-containing protein [Dictyoglomus sp.]MCX7942544.1 HIT domain-containing protein [Dictyoglomaceae bacterium]MDW8188782.1 HIT domain-containing protein [Dictyoglomus sp.]